MKKYIAIAAIAVVGWALGSPYMVSYQMKSAADARDGEALSGHIEFPTLRQNLKDQLNAALAKEMSKDGQDSFAVIGAAFGAMMVEGMVDAYVTPSSIVAMMNGEPPNQAANGETGQSTSDDSEALEDARMAYSGWDKFTITTPAENDEELQLVLQRRGIGWKLTNIVIPM
jgi:hypothetical protein